MNIDIKYWSHKNLGGIVSKENLIKILFEHVDIFEFYRKISTKQIENPPTHVGKIVYFDNKKKNWLHLYSMLSNDILKVVIASIFLVIFMSTLSMSFSNGEKPIENYVNIQVRSGDTVWIIAGRNASNEEDIRELVYAIRTINELDRNALIYPGQILKIPTTTH